MSIDEPPYGRSIINRDLPEHRAFNESERARLAELPIRPPVIFLDCGEGDQTVVHIDASAEEQRAAIRRFRRRRAAKKGWATRRRRAL